MAPEVEMFQISNDNNDPNDKALFQILNELNNITVEVLELIQTTDNDNNRNDFKNDLFEFGHKLMYKVTKVCAHCKILLELFKFRYTERKDEVNDMSGVLTYIKMELFEKIYNDDNIKDIHKLLIYLFTSFVVLHMLAYNDSLSDDKFGELSEMHHKELFILFNRMYKKVFIITEVKPVAGRTYFFNI
jgi:hypothetical protein